MFPLNITTAVAAAPSAADVAPSPAVEEQPPSHPSLDHQARLPTSFDVEDESRTPDSSGSSTSSPTISPASHTPIHDVEPYPHCPIFVPSKGRSEMERGTLAMLVRELIPFAVVVEKEEEAAYGQLLDRLVYQNFGVADMTADAGGTTTVCPPIGGSHGEDDVPGRYDHLFAKGADVEQTQAEREARARDAAMKRVSSVFHNGFQFVPPGVAVNSDSTTNKYSAAFTLRDVSAVRSLFKVKTMDESDKGVSYVRNYILHVLAPQAMVSAGIHTGLSELGYGDVKMLDLNELRLEGCSVELLVAVEESEKEEARFAANPPHSLYGFYWVLDDDIFYFNQSRTDRQKNVRISTREAMRQCESRLRHLREKTLASATASSSASPSNSQPTATMTYRINPNVGRERFTGREDMMLNNTTHSSGSPMTLETYDLYSKTACFSLEYSRYAYTYDDSAMAVNSYNNIACLWNYRLLHNPQSEKFFPEGLPTVRTPFEVLNYYGDSKMLWYRLPVREDYDFTLQLIARGMHTVRFRSLSFEVPQMAKLKGGMTDYYKNCVDEIREQNHLFVSMWPSVSQLCLKGKNSTEREDIRVEWKLLHPSRARHPGAFLFLREPLPQLQPPRRSPAGSPPDASPVEAPQPISPSAPVVLRQQKQPPIILKRPREDELLLAPPPDMSSLPIDSAVASAIDISKAAESDALELPTDSSNRSQWRGYTVERWRELHPAEAARLGLELLEQVSPGQTVAVVLPLFSQRPPLVLATVIEESRIDGETVWTVIAQRVRGIPVLTVRHCFARPSDDIGGIDGACQRIDAFFEHVDGEKNAQRRREQELLLDD